MLQLYLTLMRYLLVLFLICSSTFLFAQEETSTFVKPLPVPHRMVNDFSGFLSSSQKKTLQKELASYFKQTTNSIVIVTLDSLTDPKTKKEYTIEEAALMYFNTWGVGDKVKNNGVLLMVSRSSRRVRIQVGSGLEAILTNDACQEIVDNNLVPNFKQGLFFAGIQEGVAALEQRLDHPLPADQQEAMAPYLRPIVTKNTSTVSVQEEPAWVIGFAIIGVIVAVCILVFKFARPLSGGWYTRDGYIPRFHNGDSFHGYSSGGGWSSCGSSSSSGGGSYGGGSSSGGGASGGW